MAARKKKISKRPRLPKDAKELYVWLQKNPMKTIYARRNIPRVEGEWRAYRYNPDNRQIDQATSAYYFANWSRLWTIGGGGTFWEAYTINQFRISCPIDISKITPLDRIVTLLTHSGRVTKTSVKGFIKLLDGRYGR